MKKLLIAILFINMAQAQNEITVQRLSHLPFIYHIHDGSISTDFGYIGNREAIRHSSGRNTFSFSGNIFTDEGEDYIMSSNFSDQINQIFTDASTGYGYAINESRDVLTGVIPPFNDPYDELVTAGWTRETSANNGLGARSPNGDYFVQDRGFYGINGIGAWETQQQVIDWYCNLHPEDCS